MKTSLLGTDDDELTGRDSIAQHVEALQWGLYAVCVRYDDGSYILLYIEADYARTDAETNL